ncbi:ATP-binding cassette domain-containing protein [Akkermansiaceae bacterium]|nr:ATP-binding cassette domain-containing protein [Akkermansiaceae bacterium]
MSSSPYVIGRSPDCDLVINNNFVSRWHAELVENNSGEIWIRDRGSSNGTGLGSMSRRITESPLQEMDLVFFSEEYPVPGGVLMGHFAEWKARGGEGRASLTLGDVKMFEPGEISIGSSPKGAVCLPVLGISPRHLLVDYSNGWRIRALAGAAKLDRREIGKEWVSLKSGSVIDIGSESVSLTFNDDRIIVARQRSGFTLEAAGLGVRVRDLNTGKLRDLLSDISLSVLPGELVALMGPSGSGKTTLLNVLAGISEANRGEVRFNGLPVSAGDPSAAAHAGYVPQDDLLYAELTVAECLYFSTRYRVPGSVSDSQIRYKVKEVCDTLGLDGRIRNTRIGSSEKKTLSGGQRKRVNLAMELVTDPLVLFLDEPTSGLSSRDTRVVVEALRELATKMSIPVVVTIHQPSMRVYQNFDKVIYLKEGQLVYYGNAFPEGVEYFVREEAPELVGPDGVMEKLEERNTKKMAREYAASKTCQKFVHQRSELIAGLSRSAGNLPIAPGAESWFRQVWHASARYATCRFRDWQALSIQVAQGPLIGILLALGLGSVGVGTPLFLLVFVAIWFGTNNTARELVGERGLFRREKRSGAAVGAMLFSKVSMNALVTLVQCAFLVVTCRLFLDLNYSLSMAILICWLASLVGISTGLLISALAKTDVSAIVITPLVLIPVIIFGGRLAPFDAIKDNQVSTFITQVMPSRWGFEALLHTEKLAWDPDKSSKTLLNEEFRREHLGMSDSDRKGRIENCLWVLLSEFFLSFSLVWFWVARRQY